MVQRRVIELTVGIFILLAIVALFMLAYRVSGLSALSHHEALRVTAVFDNIGDLKIRAPVKIAGVKIGEVAGIKLDKKSYRAEVLMYLNKNENNLPDDSSASILSTSLLGSNYIAITPGFADDSIKDGGEITETHSAMILENLIGAAVFGNKKDKK